jgi:hypothetical protein
VLAKEPFDGLQAAEERGKDREKEVDGKAGNYEEGKKSVVVKANWT